jgi:hypothetical protein
MTIKQYIANKDVKLKLFEWGWATTDPEKYRIYNTLLEDFLSKPEVSSIKFRPKTLYFWHLYTGALQTFILSGETTKKLDDIVKKCPLSKRELKTLFC